MYCVLDVDCWINIIYKLESYIVYNIVYNVFYVVCIGFLVCGVSLWYKWEDVFV